MKPPQPNMKPELGLESFEELDFAKAVFEGLDEFGPEHSVVKWIANARSLVEQGRRRFPIVLTNEREASIAHNYMTEVYRADPLWGELAEDLRQPIRDFHHAAA